MGGGEMQGTLVGVAWAVGIGVLLAWVAVAVMFVRLRMVELDGACEGAGVRHERRNAVLLVIFQAATCYLLLFSHPA